MASAGTVTLELDANSVKLLRELQKAQKQTKGAAKGMQSSMANAFKDIRRQINTTVKAFGTLAVGASAAAAAIWKSNAKTIDSLAKTADKLGIATEDLAALRFAAEQTGVQTNTLDMALQRMTRRVAEASRGTGEAVGALKELGLSAQELNNLSPDETFRRIAGAMEGVPNQSDRVRLAFKLFDSEGVALVNTLAAGEQGLEDFAKQAEELGITLSRVDAKMVEDANSAIDRTSAILRGVGQQFTVQLAPVIEAFADKINDAAKETNNFQGVFIDATEDIAVAAAYAGDVIAGWEMIIAGLRVVLGRSLQGILMLLRSLGSGFELIIKTVQSLSSSAVVAVLSVARATVQGVEDLINAAIGRINTAIALMNAIPGVDIDFIGKASFKSLDRFDKAIGAASDTANRFRDELKDLFDDPINSGAVAGFFNPIIDNIDATSDHYTREFHKAVRQELPTDAVRRFFADVRADVEKTRESFSNMLRQGDSSEMGEVIDPNMISQLSRIAESTRTQMEKIREQMTLVQQAIDAGITKPFEDAGTTGEEVLKRLGEQLAELQAKADEGTVGFWDNWLAKAEETLTNTDELVARTLDTFASGFGQAFEQMIFDSENLGDAMRNMFQGLVRSMVRAVGEMIAQWLAYKAVQLVTGKAAAASQAMTQSALAHATAVQAGLNAFASTAAIPIVGPALAPAASSAALAVTMPMAATVSALAFTGMAHDGIDSVPREGTWLLDKGERVYTQDQAAKIDQMSMAIQRMSEKPTSINFTFERSSDEEVRDALRRNSSLITSMVRKALYDEGKRI